MKKYLIVLFSILLVGCTQINNVETKDESHIIDLNESNSESGKLNNNYNRNNEIKSEIYKEYFYDVNLIESKKMETDIKDGVYSLLGTDIPLAEDYFSNIAFINYTYDKNNNLLNVGMILPEGTEVNENLIPEDIFVKWIYDFTNKTIEVLKEENKFGEETNYISLNNEELDKIAEKFRSFIISLAE